uniref:Selenoprotein W-like n=1 Tax=Petromyzon marinus TaxID=7757 RepID=A0AAJ7TME1_PETMA|nr:selenoprotein W-like [Petromyzon marinus]XP_032820691.1 selenoprotein W-like [Petromyzon marinus]
MARCRQNRRRGAVTVQNRRFGLNHLYSSYAAQNTHRLLFHRLKDELETEFPGELEITGEGTPTQTGFLEVQIVGGKLLHSKANGDGFVDSDEKLQKIFSGVEKALKKK